MQYVIVHMSQYESAAFKLTSMSVQRLVVQVILDLLLKEIRFADEQVGAMRGLDQSVCPFGISRVRDRLAPTLDFQRVRGAPLGWMTL